MKRYVVFSFHEGRSIFRYNWLDNGDRESFGMYAHGKRVYNFFSGEVIGNVVEEFDILEEAANLCESLNSFQEIHES